MTASPTASAVGQPVAKAPPTGWLAVVAGILGAVGLFLPWFHPRLSKSFNGVTDLGASYHSWSGFRVLIVAPVLLIVWAVLWLQAMRGRHGRRVAAGADPIRALGIQSVAAGVIALIAALLSFVLMKYHYKDWDQVAKLVGAQGVHLQKSPQVGLYLVILGALLLIAAGVTAMSARAKSK